MQTYIVEYNYPKWSPEGNAFMPSDDYYKMKSVAIKAQNIDNLRVRIIEDYAKGKPFRSEIYRPRPNGNPNYDAPIGQLYHYKDGYIWFVRNTHLGWHVNPKTGRRLYRC